MASQNIFGSLFQNKKTSRGSKRRRETKDEAPSVETSDPTPRKSKKRRVEPPPEKHDENDSHLPLDSESDEIEEGEEIHGIYLCVRASDLTLQL